MLEGGINKNEEIKNLRTYTSDMAEAVRNDEASVIKIALAEKEKREQETIYEEAKGTRTGRTLFVIGGIILIVGAIAGFMYLFLQNKKNEEVIVPVSEKQKTFILYDTGKDIDVTTATSISDLIGIVNKENFTEPGKLYALFLKKQTDGISTQLTSKEFLSLIDSTAPGALVRSLSDNYLFGKYYSKNEQGGKAKTFLIFETTNYSQTYASMLSWEKTMLKDLYIIFDIEIPKTDGQTTEEEIFNKSWKDIIINNRDARVFYGDTGEGILYYTFINKDRLVITNDLATLKELIARLLIKG